MEHPVGVPVLCWYAYVGETNRGSSVGPSVAGQPKFAPADPSSISSQVSWPTSLMNRRPLIGWTAKVNGLRNPKAQMALVGSVAVVKNGLSVGMLPSLLMR